MFKPFLLILPVATAVLISSGIFHGVAAQSVAHEKKERRMDVIEAGRTGELAPLEAARSDREPLVRRAAARSLGRIGKPALPLLEVYAVRDEDALVRRIAVRGALKHLSAADQLVWLDRAGNDTSEWVRVMAIEGLAAMEPQTPEVTALLKAAQDDSSEEVSRRASQFLWPYHEEVVSVRERPEFRDLSLDGGRLLPLPAEGWKFQTDRTGTGHLQQWQTPQYDESSWKKIGIGRPWQAFGVQYQGIAWYRLRWKLPERPPADGVNLVFEGVDQSAWVWINGHYIGARDIGAVGWNQPFEVDVGDHLRWGEENVLSVRVSKPTGTHGGIWKPVYLDPLKRS